MSDLIEALTILSKYMDNPRNPTHCEHDILRVYGVSSDVSDDDTDKLEELGFWKDSENDECWMSYRYGSC